MAQPSRHDKSQPHFHGRDPEERRQGMEEGGRESMNERLPDGALRGVGDDETGAHHYDHSSKARGVRGEGGESEGRRKGLEAGGGIPLNRSLEDGQLRGVDEDGQIIQGTHGGPRHNPDSSSPTTIRKK